MANTLYVQFRPSSNIPEYDDVNNCYIHFNDNVTIIFNHAFKHDKSYVSDDSNATNDDAMGAPQMLAILNTIDGEKPLFEGVAANAYVPIMYRARFEELDKNNVRLVDSLPVIGIDPITAEKYAIGIYGTYENGASDEEWSDVYSAEAYDLSESGIEEHHFIYEKSFYGSNHSTNFKYGVGDDYDAIYSGCNTQSYTYSLQGISGENPELKTYLESVFSTNDDVVLPCLTKIGHFDTIHTFDTQNIEENQQNTSDDLNTLINHLINISGDYCITDADDFTYRGGSSPSGVVKTHLAKPAFLVLRTTHLYQVDNWGSMFTNPMFIDVEVQKSGYTAKNITQIRDYISGGIGDDWYKYNDYGLRPSMGGQAKLYRDYQLNLLNPGSTLGQRNKEWKTTWSKINDDGLFGNRVFNGLANIFGKLGGSFPHLDTNQFASGSTDSVDKLIKLWEVVSANYYNGGAYDVTLGPGTGIFPLDKKYRTKNGLIELSNVEDEDWRALVLNMNHNTNGAAFALNGTTLRTERIWQNNQTTLNNAIVGTYNSYYQGKLGGVNTPFIFGFDALWSYLETYLYGSSYVSNPYLSQNFWHMVDRGYISVGYWKDLSHYYGDSLPYDFGGSALGMNTTPPSDGSGKLREYFWNGNNAGELQLPWRYLFNSNHTDWNPCLKLKRDVRSTSNVNSGRGFRIFSWFNGKHTASPYTNNFKNYRNSSNVNYRLFSTNSSQSLCYSYTIIEIPLNYEDASLNSAKGGEVSGYISGVKSGGEGQSQTVNINEINFDGCCCDNVLIATRVDSTTNRFNLRAISGSYPLNRNDKFTVIFKDTYDNALDRPMMFIDGDNDIDIFGSDVDVSNNTTHPITTLAVVYKNTKINGSSPIKSLPAPFMGISPINGNAISITGYSSSDAALRSGEVHTFIYEKCLYYKHNNCAYNYGSDGKNCATMWSNGVELANCSWLGESGNSSDANSMVITAAIKVGDFDTAGSGGGGGGEQGTQGIQGVQGVQGKQGRQGVRGYQGYQGVQGTSGGSEVILRTIDVHNNVFTVESVYNNYPLIIEQNTVVRIQFNHSFDHDYRDMGFSEPQIMFIKASDTNLIIFKLDDNSDFDIGASNNELPLFYRYYWDRDNGFKGVPAPIIGIDPFSGENYAIGVRGLQGLTRGNTPAPLSTHEFLYTCDVNFVFSISSGSFYYGNSMYGTAAYYDGSAVPFDYEFNIIHMSENVGCDTNTLIQWIGMDCKLRTGHYVPTLTKVGHFNTDHYIRSSKSKNGTSALYSEESVNLDSQNTLSCSTSDTNASYLYAAVETGKETTLNVDLNVNNTYENYLCIQNNGKTDLDVVFSSVKFGNAKSVITKVPYTNGVVTIAAGRCVEFSIIGQEGGDVVGSDNALVVVKMSDPMSSITLGEIEK